MLSHSHFYFRFRACAVRKDCNACPLLLFTLALSISWVMITARYSATNTQLHSSVIQNPSQEPITLQLLITPILISQNSQRILWVTDIREFVELSSCTRKWMMAPPSWCHYHANADKLALICIWNSFQIPYDDTYYILLFLVQSNKSATVYRQSLMLRSDIPDKIVHYASARAPVLNR